MELTADEQEASQAFLSAYDVLMGDQRTRRTFQAVLAGIIGGESLRASVIARFSPGLATVKYGERRVRRMMTGETTQRSDLDPESVTGVLRQQGAAALRAEPELTLVLDGMELRRPEAAAQAHLMRVKALDGHFVNGYRSFNVLGSGEGDARGLLYHQLFSSSAPGFQSENRIIEQAITTTEGQLADFAGPKTWGVDCGFDNDDVWWQIWGYPGSDVVRRLYHFERIVLWQTPAGAWEERHLDATFKHLQPLAVVETELEVRKRGQPRPKRQTVTAHLAALPLRVYAPGDHNRTQSVWLVSVSLQDCINDPWYLLTDWPVTDAPSAQRIFRFYRRRWSVEDLFKFIKNCLGIEDVQLLDFDAIRTLVAFAWVAAGFLLHLGLTLDQAEVRLLAYLGGWEERPTRQTHSHPWIASAVGLIGNGGRVPSSHPRAPRPATFCQAFVRGLP